MKVQPEMLLKTQDRENRHGNTGHGAGKFWHLLSTEGWSPWSRRACAGAGYPGNMLETKARQNPISNHKSPFTNALTPVSSLLHFKNEGATGDMYENKGC